MPRARSPNREKAFELWKKTKGKKSLKEIAEEIGVSDSQLRKWKSIDNWDKKSTKKNGNKIAKNIKNIGKEKKEKDDEINNLALNEKQKLFCLYFVKYFNATKAYKKAYNCKYNTAMTNGCELLRNPKVAEEIKKLKEKKFNKAFISEEDIFQKMIDIAFSDITDYVTFGREEVQVMTMFGPLFVKDEATGEKTKVTKTVNAVWLNESEEVDGTIIKEIKQGKDGVSLKLYDKMKALEWLAERMDLLPVSTRERLTLEREKFEHAKLKDW